MTIIIDKHIPQTKTLITKLSRLITCRDNSKTLSIENITVDLLNKKECCINICIFFNNRPKTLMLHKKGVEDFEYYMSDRSTIRYRNWVSSILVEHVDQLQAELIDFSR